MKMNNDLIKEYVKLIIEAVPDPRFKESELKNMKSIGEIHKYASMYLDFLGEGSSRAAYLISSRKVLKVALNEKGFAQNEAEVDIYTSPKTKQIIAKITGYDPYYKWLLSELVRPLSQGEFYDFFEIGFDEFCNHLKQTALFIKQGDFSRNDQQDMYVLLKEYPNENYYTFFPAVLNTVLDGDLKMGDVCYEQHWGKTNDGRIVLYDYGFTEAVAKKHYGQKHQEVDLNEPTKR